MIPALLLLASLLQQPPTTDLVPRAAVQAAVSAIPAAPVDPNAATAAKITAACPGCLAQLLAAISMLALPSGTPTEAVIICCGPATVPATTPGTQIIVLQSGASGAVGTGPLK